ncbi:MAG TPA: PDZ domain-containing protein, partial [Candidatus Corynebacterium gallistercoris]|nr:PDZ domain-containing protein [Candidatus Corynebacterium gallistercoris]
DGADVDETSGNLNMTTVAVRTNMTLVQALGRWLTTDDTLVPIEQVLPSGKSREEVQKQNAAAFAASESNATISAMNYLGKPVETMVVEVSEDSPAEGVLRPNDIVTHIDGEEITVPGDLAKKVQDKEPGDEVTVTVQRQTRTEEFEVELGETPKELRGANDGAKAFLGVTSVAQPAGNVKVRYNLTDIGGPSAGLMFSMAVVDKLSPGELTGGKFVAGTGTIDAKGTVGPIGGITHKIAAAKDAGAEVFLVPSKNCAEAVHDKPEGITLIDVESLDDAVDDLKAYTSGGSPSLCEG